MVALVAVVTMLVFLCSFVLRLVADKPSNWDGAGTYKSSVLSPDGAYVAKIYALDRVTALDSLTLRVAITSLKSDKYSDNTVAIISPDWLDALTWKTNDTIELAVTSKDSENSAPDKYFDINVRKPGTYLRDTTGRPTLRLPYTHEKW